MPAATARISRLLDAPYVSDGGRRRRVSFLLPRRNRPAKGAHPARRIMRVISCHACASLIMPNMRVVLGSLPCTVPFMAHFGGVEPKFVIWELWPARWLPGEAWAFIDGDWKQVDSSDVGFNGREIDEESCATLFGILKTLPAIAFKARPASSPPSTRRRRHRPRR